jgi:hypothetical protein
LRSLSPTLNFPSVLPLRSHAWPTLLPLLIDIAPKLATAKRHLGASAADLVFLYPRKLRSYEVESIEALGLSPGRAIDLHRTGGVTADTVAALGNSSRSVRSNFWT